MNDYERISKVIRFLDENQRSQPSLAELAEQVGLSSSHFHRLFARWAGVTPKDFLQCLTLRHAKNALREGRSVLDASLDAGLSGPSRLHDLCVHLEAASPGEVKSGGAGWTIEAGFTESPFGRCLIAESPRGICHLSFVDSTNRTAASKIISRDWPQATIGWSLDANQIGASVFRESSTKKTASNLRTVVRGSEFQVRVWRALLAVPRGTVASYGRIAESVCDRKASRAVGSAVAKNQLAYLIPCHRVIRETGVFGEYRWDSTRKKAIVAWEYCQTTKT